MRTIAARTWILGLGVLLWTGACRSREASEARLRELPDAPLPAGVLFDPQVVRVDRAAPFTTFDGLRGSIRFGEGWRGFDVEEVDGRTFHYAWVTKDGARLDIERPPASELDFHAECRAPSDSSEMLLELDGHVVARQAMKKGWRFVRLALPDDLPATGVLRLGLRVRRQGASTESEESAEDLFRATCRWIALVPREVDDPVGFVDATRIDPEAGRLHIARGGLVTLPLPGSSEVELDLAAMAASPWDGCRLRVELASGDGAPATVWEGGDADALAVGAVRFTTSARGLGRLQLSADGCGDGRFDEDAVLRLPLDAGVPEVRRSAPADVPERPHVFVYLVDTLRADSLSPYGADPSRSPRLAELARDAVTYTDVHSASAWTLTSVVSLLTGVYPDRHRIYIGEKLSEDGFPTLASRLRSVGYATLGISQSFVAGPQFGVDVGFDDFFLSDQLNGRRLFSQRTRGRLLDWLTHDRDPERPVFAYVHTVDPHSPYLPPAYDMKLAREIPRSLPEEDYHPVRFLARGYGADSPEVAQLRARYDGEVTYADRELGRFVDLLRHLGLYDDSVIVFLSDHGEEFGEHGSFSHGRTMYEEMLRVPLLIKLPGSRGGGTRVDEPVNVVDVLPTLLELAGVRGEGGLDGRLLPPLRPAGEKPRRFDYSEVLTVSNEHLAAVHYRTFRLDGVKCVESVFGNDQFDRPERRWRAFDLEEDPEERRPLRPGEPRLVRCRKTLARWLNTRERQRFTDPSSLEAVDESALERLRAVGYIE